MKRFPTDIVILSKTVVGFDCYGDSSYDQLVLVNLEENPVGVVKPAITVCFAGCDRDCHHGYRFPRLKREMTRA